MFRGDGKEIFLWVFVLLVYRSFHAKKVEQREVSRTLLARIVVSADLLRNNIVKVASPISLVVS